MNNFENFYFTAFLGVSQTVNKTFSFLGKIRNNWTKVPGTSHLHYGGIVSIKIIFCIIQIEWILSQLHLRYGENISSTNSVTDLHFHDIKEDDNDIYFPWTQKDFIRCESLTIITDHERIKNFRNRLAHIGLKLKEKKK